MTSSGQPRPQVDAGRLWAGGLATAVVDLVVGLAVLSLLSSVMARSLRPGSRVP